MSRSKTDSPLALLLLLTTFAVLLKAKHTFKTERTMTRFPLLSLILLTLLTIACGGDQQITKVEGRITVAPPTLDFGAIAVGDSADLELVLQNTGLGEVTVVNLVETWEGSTFEIATELSEVVLGESLTSGEQRTLTIRYTPTANEVDVGILTINSLSQKGDTQTRAQFFGVGAFPELFCDPPLIDLGRVNAGNTGNISALLTNRGGVELLVSSIDWGNDPMVDIQLGGGQTLPASIQPGFSVPMDISYSPMTDDAFEITITASTDSGQSSQCVMIANNCALSAHPSLDADNDGFNFCAGDCNDIEPTVHPGAPEVADGLDNDCDGITDEGTAQYDDDGDGFSDDEGDCDDANPFVYPGPATNEVVGDGIDNNCDGLIDFDSTFIDGDGDGFAISGNDCNDTNPSVYPGAIEVPNGIDDDCDGLIDEGTAQYDDDGDGQSEANGDCDDGDPDIYVGAPELIDGKDNDCDGIVDPGSGVDADGDGYTDVLGGDCDDANPSIRPGAQELPDGLDNDCDGVIDEGTTAFDDDGDGFSEQAGDCNDGVDVVYPNAMEVADGIDNDCDGVVDEGTVNADDDGDGFTESAGDCDDADSAVHPAALEIVGDGIDNNCDGTIQ